MKSILLPALCLLSLISTPLFAVPAGTQGLIRLSQRIEAILKDPGAVETLPAEKKNALAEQARAGLKTLTAPETPVDLETVRAARIFEDFLARIDDASPAAYNKEPAGARDFQRAATAVAQDSARAVKGQDAPRTFWDGAAAPPPPSKGWLSDVRQKIYHPAVGEYTKWQHAPIKMIAYPVTKALYDLPNMATSLAAESATRSPWHNLLGAFDTACGAVKAAVGGVWRMIKGLFNPKNASLIDGALQVADSGLTAVKGALGLAKAGASIAAYPAYRLLGGKQSVYAPMRRQGKRAAIVFIDSEMPSLLRTIVDAYQEQIVRYHFSQVADYYCAVTWSNNVAGKLEDCLDKMPQDTRVVDFVALTHSGGTAAIDETVARGLSAGKPGLVISVGTYDDPSDSTSPENAMGQKGLSWAVHYYFSGLMDKRLRGIPLRQAAMQAYNEGRLINAIDPVSWGGLAAVGYQGSKPDFRPAN